ncbi:MAG: hypothetical protein ACLPID_03010 [Beijerinckiaceae bacterium]
MFRTSRQIAILVGATASLLAAVSANRAQAGDSGHVFVTVSPAFDEWQAIDHCAAYGPDFTSVAGSDACVRIGGRVRVEFSFRRSPYEADTGYANSRPAVMRSDGASEHVNDSLDGAEQGHLRVHSLDTAGQADPFR